MPRKLAGFTLLEVELSALLSTVIILTMLVFLRWCTHMVLRQEAYIKAINSICFIKSYLTAVVSHAEITQKDPTRLLLHTAQGQQITLFLSQSVLFQRKGVGRRLALLRPVVRWNIRYLPTQIEVWFLLRSTRQGARHTQHSNFADQAEMRQEGYYDYAWKVVISGVHYAGTSS